MERFGSRWNFSVKVVHPQWRSPLTREQALLGFSIIFCPAARAPRESLLNCRLVLFDQSHLNFHFQSFNFGRNANGSLRFDWKRFQSNSVVLFYPVNSSCFRLFSLAITLRNLETVKCGMLKSNWVRLKNRSLFTDVVLFFFSFFSKTSASARTSAEREERAESV